MEKTRPPSADTSAALPLPGAREASRLKNGAELTRGPARRARPRGEEITEWVVTGASPSPDVRDRLTGGLTRKKKIVAKFGENAASRRASRWPKPAKAA